MCTIVSKRDEDDWKKLKRVISYVQATIDNVRIIAADSLSTIFTWIDAAYAVTANMKIQTGGVTSLGLGVITRKDLKTKAECKEFHGGRLGRIK